MRLRTNTVYFNTADNILDVILIFWMTCQLEEKWFYCYIWIGNILKRWVNVCGLSQTKGLSIADINLIASSAFINQLVSNPNVIKETSYYAVFFVLQV